MKWKAPAIAAAAGAAVFFAGQAFWNRRARLDGESGKFAELGVVAQFWEAAPDFVRTATVGTLAGLAAFYAAKKLG